MRARMATQSRSRVCIRCSTQVKGKIRKQRCENCYRARLKRSAAAHRPQRIRWSSPAEAALAASVRTTPNGCWLYTGTLDADGYGRRIQVGGYPRVTPHRATYEQAFGAVPPGMQLDHVCHSSDLTCAGGPACQHRRCVNPEHLEPVTPRENTMRSNSPSALNARKTHCNNGHEYTPENTYRRKQADGTEWRRCRECRRESRRGSRVRQPSSA